MIALVGFQLSECFAEKGIIYARDGIAVRHYVDADNKDQPLPFSVLATDFNVETYPNSVRPRNYSVAIELDFKEKHQKSVLTVNDPIEAEDFILHLTDSGIEPTPNARIELIIQNTADSSCQEEKFETMVGENIQVSSGETIFIEDFSPSLGFKDGQFFTFNSNMPVNPAYFVLITDPTGKMLDARWILQKDETSKLIGNFRLDFQRFSGLTYSVLSISKRKFQNVVIFGALLLCAGFFLTFLVDRRGKIQWKK